MGSQSSSSSSPLPPSLEFKKKEAVNLLVTENAYIVFRNNEQIITNQSFIHVFAIHLFDPAFQIHLHL